jgi:RNA polymerase sigma factor (sigma-70 family)
MLNPQQQDFAARHFPMVSRVVGWYGSRVRDRDEWESIATTGLMEAATRWDPTRAVHMTEERWVSLCITAALNSMMKQSQRKYVKAVRSYGDDFDHPSPLSHPDEEATLREARRLVRNALGTLPHEWERVVTLHITQGVPIKEIAAKLGTSSYTARVWCRRALNRLRGRLSPHKESLCPAN